MKKIVNLTDWKTITESNKRFRHCLGAEQFSYAIYVEREDKPGAKLYPSYSCTMKTTFPSIALMVGDQKDDAISRIINLLVKVTGKVPNFPTNIRNMGDLGKLVDEEFGTSLMSPWPPKTYDNIFKDLPDDVCDS